MTQTATDAKVLCRTPTPGKQPVQIHQWKYDFVRTSILRLVPKKPPGVEFTELMSLVQDDLAKRSPQKLKDLGSVSWYTTTVKLDMEVKGELARVSGAKPQRLVRA